MPYILLSTLPIIKGVLRSCIYDLQRSNYYFIPNRTQKTVYENIQHLTSSKTIITDYRQVTTFTARPLSFTVKNQ